MLMMYWRRTYEIFPLGKGGGVVNLFFAIVRLESYWKPGCIDQTTIRHMAVRQVRVVIVGKESKKHSKYIDYYVYFLTKYSEEQ